MPFCEFTHFYAKIPQIFGKYKIPQQPQGNVFLGGGEPRRRGAHTPGPQTASSGPRRCSHRGLRGKGRLQNIFEWGVYTIQQGLGAT